jgi:hypothetical protein
LDLKNPNVALQVDLAAVRALARGSARFPRAAGW